MHAIADAQHDGAELELEPAIARGSLYWLETTAWALVDACRRNVDRCELQGQMPRDKEASLGKVTRV